MKKLTEKAQAKIGVIGLAVISLVLIATITTILIGTSNTKKIDINTTGGNVASVDVQKPEESQPTPKVEVQPIVTVPQAVEQNGTSQESDQISVSKQTEAPVKSIQEGQPQTEIKPTPPPKPVPKGQVTDKAVKPAYEEQDVKPQQSQPKMGEKNDKGQVYIEGFGWIKDEGGGGKGTIVNDMRENGNKIGIMD